MDTTIIVAIDALTSAINQSNDAYWPAFSAWATLCTGVVILFSVFILRSQLKELRNATYSQGWIFAMQHLQNEPTRRDRRRLFTLDEKGYDNLSVVEKKRWIILAERACHKYDSIGVMCKYDLFPERVFTETNKHSIIRTWQATETLVKRYQRERGKEFWAHFEWLVERVKIRSKEA